MLTLRYAPLLFNHPSESSSTIQKLEFRDRYFTQNNCDRFFERLLLKSWVLHSCMLWIGKQWSNLLSKPTNSSKLSLKTIHVWLAEERFSGGKWELSEGYAKKTCVPSDGKKDEAS
ncbi:hypothetical protein E6O75_ATG04781 [Venturia nashicola]|uniref:Uncharacterized protein n=1 Tax=Venturia nashicola TaxID=86259 RepID=A0A4Z1P9L0_9PEZI|nr:hypothetical protein E6O75_ATG04781 [Venturia nashicola]